MNKYYLKLAIRYILRNKFISSIKVVGLTLGLFFFILSYLYIQDELKYNKHFKDTDNLYRLTGNNFNGTEYDSDQPARFLPEIIAKIPEIIEGTRIDQGKNLTIKVNNEVYAENSCMYADSNFFSFFNWPLLTGDIQQMFAAPYKCVISSKIAKKYFGNESPIGKTLTVDNNYDVEIIGVHKDFPRQSHIKGNIIIALNTHKTEYPNFFENWGNFSSEIYLKTIKPTSTELINKKLANLWNTVNTSGGGSTGDNIKFIIQKFSDIHLRSTYLLKEGDHYGNINLIKGVIIVSFIILLIGLINYIILSTSQLSGRAFEIGIRKTNGASNNIMSRHVLVETVVLIFIAFVLTINLLTLLIPKINNFLNKELSINLFQNYLLYCLLFILIALIVFLLNLNPRFYFSHISPLQVIRLKRATTRITHSTVEKIQVWIKNSLIIFQFSLTILLIISLIIINKQLHLIINKDYGFSREQVIVVENEWDHLMHNRYELFKENVLKYPEVQLVSGGINVPTARIWNWGSPRLTDNEEKRGENVGFVVADFNYFKCLGAEIIQGRDFDQRFAYDTMAVVINESFAKTLDDKNIIGKRLTNMWDGQEREIIGVVKDIDFYTGQRPIKDVVFMCRHRWLPHDRAILIKINSENMYATVKKIEKVWNNIAPDWTFKYIFLDENFKINYRKELQTRTIINVLTLVAVLLSCLGLIGISLYEINLRIKEIGIRKVNGAKSSEIIVTLFRLFCKRVILAFIIACPAAWFIMNKWLQNFPDKVNINWWVFLLSGAIALVIALLTVSWQSWRAASRNPIEALRYE